MQILQWLVVAIGVLLIVLHGLLPSAFRVDAWSVLILFILSIPVVAQYLRKAKFPGAEFEFRDEIRATQALVTQSVAEADRAVSAGEARYLPFETFKLSVARDLLDSDPALALGALRIEMERTLRCFAEALGVATGRRASLSALIDAFREAEFLSYQRAASLRRIVRMCNGAVHGAPVSLDEAEEIIHLAAELNRSFAVGYSVNYSPNPEYQEQGLLCEWEHCIEWMPLRPQRTQESCPVFGHDCPGGPDRVRQCGRTMDDIPKSRFISRKQSD